MKNFWKILAALMVVALPFVVAACGGDDEDENAPKTYTYTWTLQGTQLPSSATTAEKAAALAAESSVNTIFGAELKKQGFTVDVTAQKFETSPTQNEPNSFDNKVRAAFYAVKATEQYTIAVEPLPAASKILIKRGSTNIVSDNLK